MKKNSVNTLIKLCLGSAKVLSINLGIILLLLAGLGLYLNQKKTGKLILFAPNTKNLNCVSDPVDPLFGFKANPCEVNAQSIGLVKEIPLESSRNQNFINVLIIGGSVASHLSTIADIEAILNNKLINNYPSLVTRNDIRFRVFNAAQGGAKQPQGLQAFQALQMLGYRFDAIIELSGYNEYALTVGENYEYKINPIYPRISALQFMDNSKTLTSSYLNSQYLIDRLAWLHPLHQYIASHTQLYPFLRAYVFDWTPRTDGYYSKLVGQSYYLPPTRTAAAEQSSSIWIKSVEYLYYIASKENTPYILALQPNQYIQGSKSFTPSERKLIVVDHGDKKWYQFLGKPSWAMLTGRAVRDFYPKISKKDFRIPQDDILDLRMLFKEVSHDVYTDACCHMNSVGMNAIANVLAAKVISRLDWDYINKRVKK